MQLSRNTLLILGGIIILILVVVLMAFGILPGLRTSTQVQGNFTFWSTEPEDMWRPIFNNLQKQLPGIKITYVQKSPETFRDELTQAQANLQGPDIWAMPGSYLRKDVAKLSAAPATFITPDSFQNTFADTATQEVVFSSQVWGIPLTLSTLGLYSNTDMLNSAGITNPPEDWDAIKEAAKFLTKRDDRGKITQSGIALGLSSNIRFAPEIFLSLLWQQGGDVLSSDAKTVALNENAQVENRRIAPAEDALSFLSEFSNPSLPHGGWLSSFPEAESQFALEKVAMIIGDEKTRQRILEKNPKLNFRITPLPQARDARVKKLFGATRVLVISRITQNSASAWAWALAFTAADNIKPFLDATISLSPRRDLSNIQRQDSRLRPFANQILSARTWPDPDPDKTRKIFQNMIEAVGLGRQTTLNAVEQASQKLKLTIGKQ